MLSIMMSIYKRFTCCREKQSLSLLPALKTAEIMRKGKIQLGLIRTGSWVRMAQYIDIVETSCRDSII